MLALKLGLPVGVMLQSMTSREITEWMAYLTLENEQKPQREDQQKSSTPEVLKAMFAHRVKKRGK